MNFFEIILIIILVFLLLNSFCLFKYINRNFMFKEIYIDELTQVYNRKFFNKKIILNNKKYIVIGIDIDHFKNINDTYGHLIGDLVLKTLGKLFIHNIKQDKDYVIRFGGEEFNIFIEVNDNNFDKQIIINRIENLRKKIENLEILHKDNELIKITSSFGISFDIELNDIKQQIEIADKKLYEAKKTGRNKVCF